MVDPIRAQVADLLERVAALEAASKGKKQEPSSTETPKKPEKARKDTKK